MTVIGRAIDIAATTYAKLHTPATHCQRLCVCSTWLARMKPRVSVSGRHPALNAASVTVPEQEEVAMIKGDDGRRAGHLHVCTHARTQTRRSAHSSRPAAGLKVRKSKYLSHHNYQPQSAVFLYMYGTHYCSISVSQYPSEQLYTLLTSYNFLIVSACLLSARAAPSHARAWQFSIACGVD